jgi:hypothetical protein
MKAHGAREGPRVITNIEAKVEQSGSMASHGSMQAMERIRRKIACLPEVYPTPRMAPTAGGVDPESRVTLSPAVNTRPDPECHGMWNSTLSGLDWSRSRNCTPGAVRWRM